MRHAIIHMIALSGLAAASCAANVAWAATQSETASYEIAGGIASVIGEHGRWNGACQALDAPLVTLERAPGHGAICVRHDLVTPTQSRSGRAVNGLSRRLNGILIIYQPRPGFTGNDTLSYGLEFPEGPVSREIVIDVQPRAGAATRHSLDLPAIPTPKAGDAVPECAGESS